MHFPAIALANLCPISKVITLVTMKEIALIIHEDVTLSTVTGAMDMLIHINRLFQSTGKPQPFKIVLAGENPTNNLLTTAAGLVSYCPIKELTNADLVIVPAFYGDRDEMVIKHRGIVDQLKIIYQNGTEVASLCSGIYFLAAAGLLGGKACTCHWNDIADIKKRYPDVNFLSDMVITDQGRRLYQRWCLFFAQFDPVSYRQILRPRRMCMGQQNVLA